MIRPAPLTLECQDLRLEPLAESHTGPLEAAAADGEWPEERAHVAHLLARGGKHLTAH